MNRFSTERVLLTVGNTYKFVLHEGFYYTTDIGVVNGFVKPYRIYIPKGYETDLNSIPWWVQWYVNKLGKHNLASIPHDYMLDYRDLFPTYTRKMIDQVYREALKDQGVKEKHLKILYAGVRLNSWWKEERFK